MIPNRPKITQEETARIVEKHFGAVPPPLLLIAIRGYFLNSVGKRGENDYNVWDDAVLVTENGQLQRAFNANTDPSKIKSGLAMLNEGLYYFYKGMHKNRIRAFRAFPEGVKLPCKRQDALGNWHSSVCSAINIHDGGERDTWSAGCQTVINTHQNAQFIEMRDLVYGIMDRLRLLHFPYLLIDEAKMRECING